MIITELFDKVVDAFIVECESNYQYNPLDKMDFDQIFSDTIDSMIADEVDDALNNDNIVEQIYHHVMHSNAFESFKDEKEEEEREALEFMRNPYSFLGLSWNDFIE